MAENVLHILWSGSIGGTPRAVYQLVRSQMTQSAFAPAVGFAQPTGYYYKEIKALGCGVLDLGLKNDRNIWSAWRIRKLMQPFAIHHFHSAELTLMLASVLCGTSTRVYTHRGGKFRYRGMQRLRYVIARHFLRNYFHGYSGNTKHACASASALFNMPSEHWNVTYNGIDLSLLTPQRSMSETARELGILRNGGVIIGTSGQLRDWKRIDLLLRACAELKETKYQLLIVGDGPAKGELEALAHSLRISDRTVFTGQREHIGDYLGLMDVFVLPSLALESFGNAAVEAMAHGIPTIVCSDGGGVLEHVKDGQTGFVVSSIDEMTSKLHSLIHHEPLRHEIGRKGCEFVTGKYTLDQMVRSFDHLYSSGIERR